jgi:hypothetical protein
MLARHAGRRERLVRLKHNLQVPLKLAKQIEKLDIVDQFDRFALCK